MAEQAGEHRAARDRDEEAAARRVRHALAGRRDEPPPESALQAAASRFQDAHGRGDPTAGWLRRAAALDGQLRTPAGDRLVGGDLALVLTAGLVGVLDDPGLDDEEEDALLALRPVDWAAVIAAVVGAGPGAAADPDTLADHAATGAPSEPGHAAVAARAFEVAVPALELLGILDGDRRLTRLGAWLLPRGACLVWGRDFDAVSP